MANWILILVAVLAVVSILLLLNRNKNASRIDVERRDRTRPGPDHAIDREDNRLAHMSADDRAWETATLQRNLENQQRRAALAE